MVEFDRILEALSKISGFQGAVIINSQGENLYHFQKEKISWEPILLLFKDLAGHIEAISRLVNYSFSEAYFEFEDSSITFENLKEDRILIVAASKDANLGKLRLEIRKVKSLV